MRCLLLILSFFALAAPAAAQEPEWRASPEYDVLLRPWAYEPNPIRLEAGRPVRLRFVNQGQSTHSFSAREFFRAARIRSGGDDLVDGGSDADFLFGDAGLDTLLGGSGNDTLIGGLGNDQLLGSIGNDVSAGEIGDDELIDTSGNNTLDGGLSNDSLTAGGGTDVLIGD